MRQVANVKWMLGFGMVATSLFGSAGPALAEISKELLRVDGDVMTVDEFETQYRGLTQNQPNPPSKETVLTFFKNRKLGIRAAKQLGLEKTPEVKTQFDTILYQAAVARMAGKEVESIHVSDGEAEEVYRKYPEVRIGHILLALPLKATADDVKSKTEKLRSIQAEIDDGKKSFSMAAQEYSEGPDGRVTGGDLGWHTRENALAPRIYEAAIRLKPGKTAIVQTGFGVELIENKAVRPWGDETKALGIRLAILERQEKIFEKHMTEEGKKGQVSIHPELLKN